MAYTTTICVKRHGVESDVRVRFDVAFGCEATRDDPGHGDTVLWVQPVDPCDEGIEEFIEFDFDEHLIEEARAAECYYFDLAADERRERAYDDPRWGL